MQPSYIIHILSYVLLLSCNSLFAQETPVISSAWLQTYSAAGSVRVTSWKTLRDERIVKQNLDYSCGAASLATLLKEYYGVSISEKALLKVMDKGNLRASFEDMSRALTPFGFKAQGFAASWEQLVKLQIPVVLYLKHRKDDHFSVLRGIDKDTVWLADPSLGNRTYSKAQFLAMWQTRSANAQHPDLRGKFLAVLPDSIDTQPATDFFSKRPRRQSNAGVTQLKFRKLP